MFGLRIRGVTVEVSPLAPPVILVFFGLAWATWIAGIFAGYPDFAEAWLVRTLLLTAALLIVLNALAAFVGAVVFRLNGLRVAGLRLAGTFTLVGASVGPENPWSLRRARPIVYSTALFLLGIAILGISVAESQRHADGTWAFVVWWCGGVAAGWAVASLLGDLALDGIMGRQVDDVDDPALARVARQISAIAGLAVGAAIVMWILGWTERFVSSNIGFWLGPAVLLGLIRLLLASLSVGVATRAVRRSLLDVATPAAVVDSGATARDALGSTESGGFLAASDDGALQGWCSRETAEGSPERKVAELARPLASAVPCPAVMSPLKVMWTLESDELDEVVAVADTSGTPVAYVVVRDAFVHLTGDTGWQRARR